MPLSAEFSVEGDSTVQAHTVSYGQTVDLQLLSLTDVRSIAWSFAGTSHASMVEPTITPAGSPTGYTASFPMVADPADGEGRAGVVKCLVTSHTGATAVAYRVVGVPNTRGYVPISAGEETARNLTHGWVAPINSLLAGISTMPTVVDPDDDNKTIYLKDGVYNKVDGTHYNAKLYGAVGDGVTNDTPAVAAAIAAANAAGGGTVFFPPGTYLLEEDAGACIVMTSVDNITLCGAGVGCTTLKQADGQETHVISMSNVSNIAIRHMTIDGNRANNASGGHGIRTGSGGTDNLWIEHVEVVNATVYSIGVQDGTNRRILFDNLWLHECGSDGIDIKNKNDLNSHCVASNILIENFAMNTVNNQKAGFDVRGLWVLSNIVVRWTDGDDHVGIRMRNGEALEENGIGAHGSSLTNFAIYCPGVTTAGVGIDARDVNVSNGYVNGGYRGVACSTERNKIVNVTAEACLDAGFLSVGDDNQFLHCTAKDSAAGDGFRVFGDRVRIAHSRITGNGGWGIEIDTGMVDTVLDGLYFDDNTAGVITDAGVRTRWAGEDSCVSVLTFGAKRDGATNDTAAIQAAINYVEAVGGGTVFFPKGTYRFTALVVDNVDVRLLGETGTILESTLLDNNVINITGARSGVERIHIKTSGTATAGYHVRLAADDAYAIRCIIEACASAFGVVGTSRVRIERNRIISCVAGHGVTLGDSSGSTGTHVVGNIFQAIAGSSNAVLLHDCTDTLVEGNDFVDVTNGDVIVLTSNAVRPRICNNKIAGSASDGIFLNGTLSGVITGNMIASCAGLAINIASASAGLLIRNNFYSGNGTNAAVIPTKTIASGAVTITGDIDGAHPIAGEGAAADDLVTINGTVAGQQLTLAPSSDTVTITVKNGTGNIFLAGSDFAMDNLKDRLLLVSDGTNLYELGRGNNGA